MKPSQNYVMIHDLVSNEEEEGHIGVFFLFIGNIMFEFTCGLRKNIQKPFSAERKCQAGDYRDESQVLGCARIDSHSAQRVGDPR